MLPWVGPVGGAAVAAAVDAEARGSELGGGSGLAVEPGLGAVDAVEGAEPAPAVEAPDSADAGVLLDSEPPPVVKTTTPASRVRPTMAPATARIIVFLLPLFWGG